MDAILAALNTLIALTAVVLSLLAFRQGQAIRKEALEEQRRAQARLVTCWWTRVSGRDGADISLRDDGGATWPDESGRRIWIVNGGNECVYDCYVTTHVEPGPDATFALGIASTPAMFLDNETLYITHGTLPPGERAAYFLDPNFASSPGELTIHFCDAAGRKWRRSGGHLVEVEQ